MSSYPGLAAGGVLANTPMPERVAAVLAEDYRNTIAGNRCLTGPLRVQLLTARPASRRPPAWVAERLCAYPFTAEEATAIADVERRKGPIDALVEAADTDALMALVGHRNPLASGRAGRRLAAVDFEQMDVESLLEVRDRFAGVDRLRVLLAAPPALLSDEAVAESLVSLDDGDLDLYVNDGLELLARLFMFRPGLLDAVAAHGFPRFAQTPAAASLHLRPGHVKGLVDGTYSSLTSTTVAVNPWATGALTAPPEALDADETAAAWSFYESLDNVLRPLTRCGFTALAASAHLDHDGSGSRPSTAAAALEFYLVWSGGLPDWVAGPLLAAFRASYPGVELDLTLPEPLKGSTPPATAPQQLGRDAAEELFRAHRCDDVPIVDPVKAAAVYTHLSERLGDDVDAWRTVVGLIDSFDGYLHELVDVAFSVAATP